LSILTCGSVLGIHKIIMGAILGTKPNTKKRGCGKIL
jgi:hypothetical protein